MLGIEIMDSVLVSWEYTPVADGEFISHESGPAAWTYIMWTGEVATLWGMFALEAVMLSLSYRALGGMGGAEPPAIMET